MSSKKIKLKTSINNINAKTKQNKKKSSTKLKLILADPYKYQIPTLLPHKLHEFSELVQSEISKTSSPGRECAKNLGILLGMSSSLRSISNRNASYVLISKSVKPKFILQQIAYFAKQRNSRTPVFSVTDLEDLSKKLFGVKSTVLTITNSTTPKFTEWIAGQTLAEEKRTCVAANSQDSCDNITKTSPLNKYDKSFVLLKKGNSDERAFVPSKVFRHDQQLVDNRIKTTGDYMAFSVQTSYPNEDILVGGDEHKRGRRSILNEFREISNRQADKSKKGQTKGNFTSEKLYKKDYDYSSSYATLKTLVFISDKNKSKKGKQK